MRKAFIGTLERLAEADPRIVLLTGDLGFTVVEPFAEKFPDRFFNAGVAEQNMVGLATGLAEAGFVPFVYSIVTFAAIRPYEFIRNGPVLQQLPVRVVAVGSGFEYGSAGPTHFGLEDLSIMRTQAGLRVICPADHRQAEAAFQATWDLSGPTYYRIGKDDRAVIPQLDGRFSLGEPEEVRTGADLLMIAVGSITKEVIEAADDLATQGVECTLLVVSALNPPPKLAPWLSRFRLALSVEAHYINGGLGSLVAEVIAEEGINCRLVRCGVRTTPDGLTGSNEFMNELHGISPTTIAKRARLALEGSVPEWPR